MLLVTTMVSNHQLECDRGQGQIYLKSVSWFVTTTPLVISDGGCSYNITIAYGVKITKKASIHHHGPSSTVLKFCLKDRNTKSPFIFYKGCSYLAH